MNCVIAVNRLSLGCVLALMFATTSFRGQSTVAAQHDQQTEQLSYFVGAWKLEGSMLSATGASKGHFEGTSDAEWLPGHHFLQAHETFKSPSEDGTALSIMGYDPDAKNYIYYSFASSGSRESSTGVTQDGKVWVWTYLQAPNSRGPKFRYTVTVMSSTSYSMLTELSTDGEHWRPFMRGTATRISGK